MSKAMIGRLILESSTGMHGEESRILADAWADMAQQRAELLEALKKAQQDVKWMTNSGKLLNRFVFDYIDEAITKTEAAE